MNWKDIRWLAAFGGMLVAEVGQIAAAFAWVAFYSYFVHPGETAEFYQRYAQASGPWVSLVAGTPIFYLTCRWIGSRVASKAPSSAWPTAMALFGFFVVVDGGLLLAAASMSPLPPGTFGFVAASFLLKLVACHLGGRAASRSAGRRVERDRGAGVRQDWETLLPLLVHIQAQLDGDLGLEALSRKAGLSPFHLQRLFKAAIGETPKAYTPPAAARARRLPPVGARLERARHRARVRFPEPRDVSSRLPPALRPGAERLSGMGARPTHHVEGVRFRGLL